MRYHTFKSSRTRNLIIADSQCRNLIFPNFNILSLPGAQISHAYKFLPAKGRYNLITLFIGGNDLFDGIDNSSREPIEVAEDIAKLASKLLPLANFVYVLGIPPRGENDENTKKKAKTTNDLIQVERKKQGKKNKQWEYRGVSNKIYTVKHLGKDLIHLEGKGLGGLCTILKKRILEHHNLFSEEVNRRGHLELFECSGTCTCGSFNLD